MSLRSAFFCTVTSMSGCLLLPLGCPVNASTEPPQTTHHHPTLTPPAPIELPFFAPGLWEYRRTVTSDDSPGPQFSMLRQCADPSTEIRRKMTDLGKTGCRFAPLAHRRGRYISNWTCVTPLGPTSFRAVLVVRGAVGYTHVSEMRAMEHVSRQRIEATRIGDCPSAGHDAEFR